jgi:L-ascorbate metabolism protein UlaG (beta-lactamase superfamily)
MGLPAGTTISWYGHSVIRIATAGGKTILIDPWFGNPSSPMSADAVERCDVLLVTHGHFDHMGDAVALASRLRPVWPCMHEMSLWLARRLPGGADAATGMNKGGTVDVDGIKFSMTHAIHSSAMYGDGPPIYLGEAAGYVVEFENQTKVYFAGDTAAFTDMQLIGKYLEPDVVVLPIGDHFTMGPRQAAVALELLGAKRCVPCHYGTFPILTGTPDALREHAPGVEVLSPEPGETISV